jgi:two-component sensor histidine kinase
VWHPRFANAQPKLAFLSFAPISVLANITELAKEPGVTDKDMQRPVVEPNPQGDAPDLTKRALAQRIRQQEILAELGVLSLQHTAFEELLDKTAQLVAEGLQADYSKVMQYLPDEKRLLVRAGVGWPPGVVGQASVGADLASPAGFALRTGKPVISNHLENEERFRTPELLVQHGIRRAMNVILQGDGAPFGVLEVDSRSDGEFVPHDLAFLQGAANVLGMAIERQRHERSLKLALERQRLLMHELNHRVKNSLGIVSSMLSLQAHANGDDESLKRQLQEAASRVATVARAHERLYQTNDVEELDVGAYIKDVCADLPAAEATTIAVEALVGIRLSTDRAISLALIVVELVTNAMKYAYRGASGVVWVALTRKNDTLVLSVRDDGRGLPAGFAVDKSMGLGMRIVAALTSQLEAELTFNRLEKGTCFELRMPIQVRRSP